MPFMCLRLCLCRSCVCAQGHYCPAVANRVHKASELGEGPHINLKGVATGNTTLNLALLASAEVGTLFPQLYLYSTVLFFVPISPLSPPPPKQPTQGHYCPAVANRVYKASELGEGPRINLKGVAIGNGMTMPAVQFPAYADFALQNNLIDQGVSHGGVSGGEG